LHAFPDAWSMRDVLRRDSPWPQSARDAIIAELLVFDPSCNAAVDQVLLVLCLPIIEAVFVRKRNYDPDRDDLWQTLIQVFFTVIRRLDISQRPSSIPQKIFNDLQHDLYARYESAWDWNRRMVVYDDFAKDKANLRLVPSPEDELQRASIQKDALARLRQWRDEGRIDEFDFLLLTATEVYGREIKEFAAEQNRDYEAVKKRRQRLLKKISTFGGANVP